MPYRRFAATTLALLLPVYLLAQTSFTFEPAHTEATLTEPGFYQFHALLTNISDDDDIYIITRLSEEMPAEWTSSLCTHHYCAPPFIGEVGDTIAAGQSDELFSLDVQTAFEVSDGDQGVVRLRIASTNDPSDFIEHDFTITIEMESSVGEGSLPLAYALDPVYPNPFNASARISFTLPDPGEVTLQLLTLDGRLMDTLAEGFLPAGNHQRMLQGQVGMASGVYLVLLRTERGSFSQRAVLLK